jgi:malate dehydrogenase (oxaloacetate-decarboxylating)(NADP+)
VRATAINEEMKIAAADAIAELARQQVPEEVAMAYGKHHSFGRDYIIPAPFDPRLMEVVPAAVAKAAMDTGVGSADRGFQRLSPCAQGPAQPHHLGAHRSLCHRARKPKRVIFAEAENEVVLRAAIQFRDFGYGTPVLVGRTKAVRDKLAELGVGDVDRYEIHNAADSPHVEAMGRCSTSGCNAAVIWSATSAAWSTRTATPLPRRC